MSAQRVPVGNLIDNLGILSSFETDELVESAMVILKITSPDGHPCVRHLWSGDLDFITRRGLLEAVLDSERGGGPEHG